MTQPGLFDVLVQAADALDALQVPHTKLDHARRSPPSTGSTTPVM
jgi:hypothetical protein